MSSQSRLITSLKDAVETDDIEKIREHWADIQSGEEEMDWPTVFQKVYLHACLRGRGEIASWLQNIVYPMMDPIQKIALRQVFSYGRHLLKKVKA